MTLAPAATQSIMKLTFLRHSALCFALCAAACQPEQTSIAIAIDAPGLTITSLVVTVTLSNGVTKGSPLAPTLPGRVVVVLPDVALQVTVAASATDSTGATWQPQAMVTSIPHHQVDVRLHLGDGAQPDMNGADLPPIPDGGVNDDLPPAVVPSLTLLAGELGGPGEADGKGTGARLTSAQGVAIVGNSVYVVETYSGRIRKVTSDGTVTTVLLVDPQTGNPASVDNGVGLVWDGARYLYVSEYYGCDLQRIDLTAPTATGAFTMARVSGAGGEVCGFVNGDVDHSQLNKPGAMALDASGNIWIVDALNYAVRSFDIASGLVSTIAGAPPASGTMSAAVDGSSSVARFGSPEGIAVIGTKVYVTDGPTIRLIDSAQLPTASTYVTTVLPAGANGFSSLTGIVPGDGGSLLVLDLDGVVHRVIPGTTPSFTTVAGNLSLSDPVDGDGVAAVLQSPAFMQVDGNGTAWFSDGTMLRTLKIGAPWTVTTIAGVATHAGHTGTPTRLDMPAGIAWDSTSNIVYIADYSGNRIRAFQLPNGPLTILAGSGGSGHHDDVGTAATFGGPVNLALDGSGHLFVSDSDSAYVRKVTLASGQVMTVAGTGDGTLPGFYGPKGLVFDGDHTVYISDFGHNCVRSIDSVSSALGVVAGTCDANNAGNSNGPAAGATFYAPAGLAMDHARHLLFIADVGNRLIRQIDLAAGGQPVTTLSGAAGTGTYVDNTTLAAATYASPYNLGFDEAANILYVADQDNSAVRKLDLGAGQVTTLIGDGNQRTAVGSLPASINMPYGLAPTPAGLLVTSQNENALLLAK
jgi:sugar lactone lactonase YvrE